jgi:hypothetical protein
MQMTTVLPQPAAPAASAQVDPEELSVARGGEKTDAPGSITATRGVHKYDLAANRADPVDDRVCAPHAIEPVIAAVRSLAKETTNESTGESTGLPPSGAVRCSLLQ